jgi:hypothetical protein
VESAGRVRFSACSGKKPAQTTDVRHVGDGDAVVRVEKALEQPTPCPVSEQPGVPGSRSRSRSGRPVRSREASGHGAVRRGEPARGRLGAVVADAPVVPA